MELAVKTREFLIIFHIDPPYQVNQLEEGCEVETDIIVQLNVIEIFKGMNRGIHPIDSRMGQLVILVVTAICNWHIGIPRRRCQQNLLGLPIDGHDDIDI